MILLIPGNRGRSQLYHDLKKLLLEDIPVISQVVLTGTINYAHNLKAIVSKILAQICAKIGGVPWAVDHLPFTEKKTMFCGLDVFHETEEGVVSVMGLVSSYNKTGTKFWSATEHMKDVGQEMCLGLQKHFIDALNHFKEVNSEYPSRIILFRDGVGDAQMQPISSAEIDQIL